MNRTAYLLRLISAIAALTAAATAGSGSRALAGPSMTGNCAKCAAAIPSVFVDPASYKLWPSGARTFLNVRWTPTSGEASFDLRNAGADSSPAFAVSVTVSNHDPILQTPINELDYSYPVTSLAPGAATTITVPLDPSQCDIFVSIDLGSGAATVLRTGNPAAC
jgi:hypothetical protein